MTRVRLWLAAMAAAVAGLPCAAAPLEVYGRLPSIEAADISPDGSKLVLTRTNGGERQVVVREIADGSLPHVLGVGPAKIRDVQWAGPGHLIITTSKTATLQHVVAPRQEILLAFSYDLSSRKLFPLMKDAPRALPTIYARPVVRMIGGRPLVFVQSIRFNSNGQGFLCLYRIDPSTGTSAMVEEGGRDTRAWLVGADGAPLAQTTYDPRSGRWSLKLKKGPGWRESRVIEVKDDRPVMVGLGRDGRSVLVEELLDGSAQTREVSPDGDWSAPLAIEGYGSAIFDPKGHNLIGVHALVGDEDRYGFFNAEDQAAWRAVQKAFPGRRVVLSAWSDDRRKLLVEVDSPDEGPGFALVDLATQRADWIASRYEKLEPQDISPVTAVRYKAQDGGELSGYLTAPRGRAARNLPLVVLPHGGPAARDAPGFDWWAQALASRGYAVLQVNFRGSDGFGWDFLKAGFGQWGRKMQTDLSDGVRHLAGEGIVDPKRVCIVGASYGGYAALAGPSLDPGVYRCAAAYAGISDLRSYIPWVRSQNGVASQRYLIRFLGAESDRDPSLSQISPAAHVDKVSVPILLIHGKDDTVVPLDQSRTMADALKKAGKPVELVVQDGADHWLTGGDTRLAMLQAVVAFLERHNPPN